MKCPECLFHDECAGNSKYRIFRESSHPLILDRWQKRFRFYLVDEFQDINPLQYDILMLLTQYSVAHGLFFWEVPLHSSYPL